MEGVSLRVYTKIKTHMINGDIQPMINSTAYVELGNMAGNLKLNSKVKTSING